MNKEIMTPDHSDLLSFKIFLLCLLTGTTWMVSLGLKTDALLRKGQSKPHLYVKWISFSLKILSIVVLFYTFLNFQLLAYPLSGILGLVLGFVVTFFLVLLAKRKGI